ncbi:MAG TPA: single-stranded DNA-binding protein [Solirubrobacteraceae bacterium]|jgi:single-stranded DNA-binding protein|nr:single-stranded DNA-binding protein [Solirubrobacteraceae bacterium]
MNIKNEVTLTGRLADDVEPIHKRSDNTLIGFRGRLGYTDPKGGTGWISFTCWSPSQNEDDAPLQKGASIEIKGALGFDSWEKDGQKRQAVTLVATSITIAE